MTFLKVLYCFFFLQPDWKNSENSALFPSSRRIHSQCQFKFKFPVLQINATESIRGRKTQVWGEIAAQVHIIGLRSQASLQLSRKMFLDDYTHRLTTWNLWNISRNNSPLPGYLAHTRAFLFPSRALGAIHKAFAWVLQHSSCHASFVGS